MGRRGNRFFAVAHVFSHDDNIHYVLRLVLDERSGNDSGCLPVLEGATDGGVHVEDFGRGAVGWYDGFQRVPCMLCLT